MANNVTTIKPGMLTTQNAAELASLEASLVAWQVSEPPPLSLEQARNAVTVLKAARELIDPRQLVVMIDETLALWPTSDNFAATGKFYVEALEEYPADIVAAALRRVRMTHKYPRMPLPADFRAAVGNDATRRFVAHGKAEMAVSNLIRDARLKAERERRQGEPWRVPTPTLRKVDAKRDDGNPETDLGNTDERIADWRRRAANMGIE